MNNVLLDCSFCIRLMNSSDPLHKNALAYFEYFLSKKIDIYLSTIVVAEYAVRGDANNLPLDKMKILTFDFLDGKTAGEMRKILIEKNNINILDESRAVVINDIKLLAQIYNKKLDGYISKDKTSFRKIITPILESKPYSLNLIDLETPLNELEGKLF